MRISQRMLYNNYIGNANDSLSKLMDLNEQATSQKRVNKPSDDPAGTYRILDHKQTLRSIDQFQSNIDTAKGWLKQADDTIVQINNIVTRFKEIAEQAATGTLSRDNREEVSYEARQLYGQLVGLVNVNYEGKSIFAGHKVDQPSFEEALWINDNDGSLAGSRFTTGGNATKSVVIQFLDTGPLAIGSNFRYSKDGGNTFTNGSVTADASGGLLLDMNGTTVTFDPAAAPTVKANSATNVYDTSGTWMRVYPTARYKGDDNDGVTVDPMGAGGITATAAGAYKSNVMVRIDSYAAGSISYSYSQDGGQQWTSNNTAPAAAGDTQALLTVPGGTLNLTMPTNVGTDLATGQQFAIKPRMANINFEISPSETVTVNSVGKDIFGGIYKDPAASYSTLGISDPNKNLFDTVGRFIASLETNSQNGVQESLENFRTASQHLLNNVASIAGRENRVEVANTVLGNLKYNETERLASVEDVDITELMTRLTQQQVGYQAVLKSSSTIMKMSLLDYL